MFSFFKFVRMLMVCLMLVIMRFLVSLIFSEVGGRLVFCSILVIEEIRFFCRNWLIERLIDMLMFLCLVSCYWWYWV